MKNKKQKYKNIKQKEKKIRMTIYTYINIFIQKHNIFNCHSHDGSSCACRRKRGNNIMNNISGETKIKDRLSI